MTVERAASIVGLQSVGSIHVERVLIVYREVVDGSLAQYYSRDQFFTSPLYFESKSGRRQLDLPWIEY